MKAIACWAHHHRWTARLLIFFFYIAFVGIALLLGRVLLLEKVVLPLYSWYVVALLTFSSAAFYPTVKKGTDFWARKRLDGVLLTCTFVFMLLGSNHSPRYLPAPFAAYACTTIATVQPLPQTHKKENKNFLKSFLQKAHNVYKHAGKRGRIGWVLFAVFIAIVLGIGIAALGCSIACSGSAALGIAIVSVGWAALIFLLVKIIKRISRDPKKKPGEVPEAGTPTL